MGFHYPFQFEAQEEPGGGSAPNMEEKVYDTFLELQDFINWAVKEKILFDKSETFNAGYQCGYGFEEREPLLSAIAKKFDAVAHFAPAYENVLIYHQVLARCRLEVVEERIKEAEWQCDDSNENSELSRLRAEQKQLEDERDRGLKFLEAYKERELENAHHKRREDTAMARLNYERVLQSSQEQWGEEKERLAALEEAEKEQSRIGQNDFFAETYKQNSLDKYQARLEKIRFLKEQLMLIQQQIEKTKSESSFPSVDEPNRDDIDNNAENNNGLNRPSDSRNVLLEKLNETYERVFSEYDKISKEIKSNAFKIPTMPQMVAQFVASIMILFGEIYLIMSFTNKMFRVDSGLGFLGSQLFIIALPLSIGMLFKLSIILSKRPKVQAKKYIKIGLIFLLVCVAAIATLNAIDLTVLFAKKQKITPVMVDQVGKFIFIFYWFALFCLTFIFSGVAGILIALCIKDYKQYHRLVKGGFWGFFRKFWKKKPSQYFKEARNKLAVEIKNETAAHKTNYDSEIEKIEQDFKNRIVKIDNEREEKIKRLNTNFFQDFQYFENEVKGLFAALNQLREERARLKALNDDSITYEKVNYREMINDLKEAILNNIKAGLERGRNVRIMQEEEDGMIDILLKKNIYKKFPSVDT